jgi:diketogulonate reductase-like aldo/keto reductase
MNPDSTVRLHNGVEMPVFGLGTWQAEQTLTSAAVQEALKVGYRLVDAAWIYMNQKEVGEGMRLSGVQRDKVFLVSKLWMVHFQASKVRSAIEQIMEDLEVTYLDQLLLHWPIAWATKDETSENWYLPKNEHGNFTVNESVDIKDTWRELEKLYEEGKLRSIGVSNFSISELQYIVDHAKIKPQVNQVELHVRLAQTELKAFCKEHDIQVVGYAPLGSPGAMGVKSLLEDPVVASVAAKHKSTNAAVLIRWSLQHGNVVIPKSTTPERIRGNLGCFDFELDIEDMVVLDAIGNDSRQRIFNPPFRSNGRKVFDI